MYKYSRYLKLEIQQGQSIFLWGARKTGKSTYLKEIFKDSLYIDLLKTDLYLRYSKQPSLLREEVLALSEEQLNKPIIIDEVQKVVAVLDEVHWLIENSRATFILCGSSSRKLKQQGSNLLGGRAIKYGFFPLVYPEYKEDFDLLKIFNHGLIPAHFLSKNFKKLLQAYIEDYLTNEIRAEGYVRNIPAFSRFLDSTRFSCCEMVNFTNVARDVGIDSKTIKEYYQILVDTMVGYLIYPYSKKIKRNIISHSPKFYYFDVGLFNRLAKRNLSELATPESGKAMENYIVMELLAYLRLNESDYDLFYWRTNTGVEVDFIISDGFSKPIPIEVKVSQNIHNTQLKPLKIFMNEYEVKKGYVVCLEPNPRKLLLDGDKEILILPIQEFLDKLWSKQLEI